MFQKSPGAKLRWNNTKRSIKCFLYDRSNLNLESVKVLATWVLIRNIHKAKRTVRRKWYHHPKTMTDVAIAWYLARTRIIRVVFFIV